MKNPSKINRVPRFLLYGLLLALFATGVAILWPSDGLEPSGLAVFISLCRQAHGALAMLALVGLGALSGHVRAGLNSRRNRASGWLMLTVTGALIGTAWALYYWSPGSTRDHASLLHTGVGLGLGPLLLLHVLIGKRDAPGREPKTRRKPG